MATEIERKFLVTADDWKNLAEGIVYSQGYLSGNGGATVRVRTAGKKGFLTIKGPTQGFSRSEFEYEIPLPDALAMLETLARKPLITKKRYTVTVDGHVWEVDEFSGENQGLVVAEIELSNENQAFTKPAWIGEEVTGDARYYNVNLSTTPYSRWR